MLDFVKDTIMKPGAMAFKIALWALQGKNYHYSREQILYHIVHFFSRRLQVIVHIDRILQFVYHHASQQNIPIMIVTNRSEFKEWSSILIVFYYFSLVLSHLCKYKMHDCTVTVSYQ